MTGRGPPARVPLPRQSPPGSRKASLFCVGGLAQSRPMTALLGGGRRPGSVGAVLGLVCVALLALAPGVASAESASSIVVEGNRRVDAETVRGYFHSSPGGSLDAAA